MSLIRSLVARFAVLQLNSSSCSSIGRLEARFEVLQLDISKEKIGVVNLPLLNNPLHHLVLTAYHRCVAHNIIMMMVKFDCSGPATNHLQNLIDAVGINLFTVLIMTGCH